MNIFDEGEGNFFEVDREEDEEMGLEMKEDENKNLENHRFLPSIKRHVKIDPEQCQAVVGEEPELKREITQLNILFSKKRQLLFSYTVSQERQEELEEYLQFVQTLVSQECKMDEEERKMKRGDGMILAGWCQTGDQMNEMALNFLQRMNYDFVKAKFYLLFPTLLVYNGYKPNHQLVLTEEYMKEKISLYIQKLNEDKMSQQQKWKQEILELLGKKTKVHLNQIQHFIDIGQQLKYDIPESIKNIYSQSISTQKALTRILKNQEKHTIKSLKDQLEAYEDQLPVVTNEIVLLKDIVARAENWQEKVGKMDIPWQEEYEDSDKKASRKQKAEVAYKALFSGHSSLISFKALSSVVNEYKALPIENKWFEQVHKRLHDYVQSEILDRIGKLTRQSKTRHAAQVDDKISFKQAQEFYEKIHQLPIQLEEFDYFCEQYRVSLVSYERAKMYLEDKEQNGQLLNQLIREIMDSPFQIGIQEQLQDLNDYNFAMEKLRKTIECQKIQEACDEIQQMRDRGLDSEELTEWQRLLDKIMSWNKRFDQMMKPTDNITLLQYYESKIEPVDLETPSPEIEPYIEKAKIDQIQQLQSKSTEWSNQIKGLLNSSTRLKTRKCSFQQLWELVKEGLQYYRNESQILNKSRTIICQIVEWASQFYQLLKELEIRDFQDFSLVQVIGEKDLEQLSIKLEKGNLYESSKRLLKLNSIYIQKEQGYLEQLMREADRWNEKASQVSNERIQEGAIQSLIEEGKHLPIDKGLLNKTLSVLEANRKALNIIELLTQKEDAMFEELFASEFSVDMNKQVEYQQFYAENLYAFMEVLRAISQLDSNKLKKMCTSYSKKLKDMSNEFNECQSFLQDQFQKIRHQIAAHKKNYEIWITKLETLMKIKKKAQDNDTFYYLKIPSLVILFKEAAQQSFFSNELYDLHLYLKDIHHSALEAWNVYRTGDMDEEALATLPSIPPQVYMPQFQVIKKLAKLISNWQTAAKYIIDGTPRTKNIIIAHQIKDFINYLHTIPISDFKESTPSIKKNSKIKTKLNKSASKQTPEQPSQILVDKPKREKKVSKLMQDESMTFYDPNLSLKKVFGEEQQAKTTKKYKHKIDIPQFDNQKFIESFKATAHELEGLYNEGGSYCICRQTSESTVTDWNLVKSLNEKKPVEFYLLHLKQQQLVKYMVACDSCEEWYHYECVGLKVNQIKDKEKYICRVCILKTNPFALILTMNEHQVTDDYQRELDQAMLNSGEYIYNTQERSTYEQFQEMMDIGKKIRVHMLEYELLHLIDLKMLEWRERARQLIPTIKLKEDHTIAHAQKLYTEATWFFVQFREEVELLALIQKGEFVKKALDVLHSKGSVLGKGKNIKKFVVERTEQIYKAKGNLKLNENDQYIMELIQALKVQLDLTNNLQNQMNQMKNGDHDLDDYKKLADKMENEYQERETKVKFSLNKLQELKQTIYRVEQWEISFERLFRKIGGKSCILTGKILANDVNFKLRNNTQEQLSHEYYDGKPKLVDILQNLKDYETQGWKLQSKYYNFGTELVQKGQEFEQLINKFLVSQCTMNEEQQLKLCKETFKLKCKIQNFPLLMQSVTCNVQMQLINWVPIKISEKLRDEKQQQQPLEMINRIQELVEKLAEKEFG